MNEDSTTEPKTLMVATDSEPTTFDWAQATQAGAQFAGIQYFETLYAVDEEYKPKPMLASADPNVSEDGLTYDIPLRSDVKFHNNNSLKARDVVASLKRWGKVSPNGEAMWDHVAKVQAQGDDTVRITLKTDYDVERALAIPTAPAVIMPKEIIDEYGADEITDVDDLISTGPYELVDIDEGKGYTLEKFGAYKDSPTKSSGLAGPKTANIENIEVEYVPDDNTRYQSTASGEYDMAINILGDFYDQLESDDSIKSQIISPYYVRFLIMNTDEPPFADPEIRRAAALAIDPEALGANTYGNEQLYELQPGIYPDGMGVLSSDVGSEQYTAFDIDEAKASLANSDYNGETVTIMTNKEQTQVYNASVNTESQLSAAGFNVDLEVVDESTFSERYTETDKWDMFNTSFGVGYIMPPSHLLLTGKFPYNGWYASGDLMEDLVNEWHQTRNESPQDELMDKIQEQFYKDQPAIKVGDRKLLNAISDDLDVSSMDFYWPTYWDVTSK